ncbi:response regulator [Ensifer sp.]|uniref:response regulator n=1 Tax=Ensifer sp. TaxID=1872086 RepID=UPI000DD6E6A7|nr:response regulator [Ensifer sp.]
MAKSPKRLLVVEDDVHDARFVTRALSQTDDTLDVVHVIHADEAVLRMQREHFDYVLLDIKMPGIDGMELLRRIRSNEGTAVVPVIVLTSSTNPSDVVRSYKAGANAYAAKPSSLSGYRQFAEAFVRFWIDNTLPPGGAMLHQ